MSIVVLVFGHRTSLILLIETMDDGMANSREVTVSEKFCEPVIFYQAPGFAGSTSFVFREYSLIRLLLARLSRKRLLLTGHPDLCIPAEPAIRPNLSGERDSLTGLNFPWQLSFLVATHRTSL